MTLVIISQHWVLSSYRTYTTVCCGKVLFLTHPSTPTSYICGLFHLSCCLNWLLCTSNITAHAIPLELVKSLVHLIQMLRGTLCICMRCRWGMTNLQMTVKKDLEMKLAGLLTICSLSFGKTLVDFRVSSVVLLLLQMKIKILLSIYVP